jgi:hypothetical protein
VWRPRDQARRALLLGAVLALPACTERISELDPRPGLSNLFFRTHLEGREPPPGLDGDWPNLSSVPPRPEPPSAETRQSLSADLAADRARSRTPLEPAGGAARSGGETAPPAPPRLAAAPPILLEPGALPAPAPAPAPAAQPIPARPAGPPAAQQPAAMPAPAPPPAEAPRTPEPTAAPPPAPAPELLAPAVPPPPSRDLLAPPPPPSRDLLAPRGG